MKTFFWLPKTASKLSNPLAQRLPWHSLAAILAVVLIASARPVKAEVVYTPVSITIKVYDRGHVGHFHDFIDMDLNDDEINDFQIQAGIFPPGCRMGVSINPTTGNGIVVGEKGSIFASLLPRGAQINSQSIFYKADALILYNRFCGRVRQESGYLGLEFQINGETHYGWALVNIIADPISGDQMYLTTTLVGFAYETIPGSPIKAGQTSGAADDPTAADPESTNREDFDRF